MAVVVTAVIATCFTATRHLHGDQLPLTHSVQSTLTCAFRKAPRGRTKFHYWLPVTKLTVKITLWITFRVNNLLILFSFNYHLNYSLLFPNHIMSTYLKTKRYIICQLYYWDHIEHNYRNWCPKISACLFYLPLQRKVFGINCQSIKLKNTGCLLWKNLRAWRTEILL